MSIPDERWAAFDRQVEETIATHGWMIQGVFPTPDSDDPFCFAYIVGLRTSVIVHGLELNAAHHFLNMVAEEVLGILAVLKDGDTLKDAEGHTLAWFFNVTANSNFGVQNSRARARGDIWVAMQCLIADDEYRAPWDPEYDPSYLQAQGIIRWDDGSITLKHYDRTITPEELTNGDRDTEEGA